MHISVLICSHHPREDYLRRVLEALRAQTLSYDEWELLLIDNGSREPLSARWDLSWHPRGRHVREDELGLTAARLRGIRESTGKLLVFVDDDNVLDSSYLEKTVELAASHPMLSCFGGSSLPEFEIPPPAWATEYLPQFLALYTVTRDGWGNIRDVRLSPFGAGLVIRRHVGELYIKRAQEKSNMMRLGRTGKRLYGYEDSEIVECARKSGAGSGRFAALQLTHLIPRERLTLDYFLRHAEDDAYSHVFFREQNGLESVAPPPSGPRKLILLAKSLLHGDPPEHRQIDRARWRGYERGIRAWQESQSAQD
jgi:glycosyltransferase involved in cell wall biosynthesis